MTFLESKSVPILQVCDSLHAIRAVVSESKGYALLHAPYREDNHPSLKVDLKKNRWYDLAKGLTGDNVDLVAMTHNCDANTALKYLETLGGFGCMKSISAFPKKKKNDNSFLSAKPLIKPLQHPALLEYIRSRAISAELAKRYLFEMHTSTPSGKSCFAIAFPSLSGGYELRNATFKGCVGKKDISVIGNGHIFLFFEGFFDFLSHSQIFGYNAMATYIVLNSTSMARRAVSYLANREKPSAVELWLDADDAGRLATSTLLLAYPHSRDMSYIYADYADMNDYLLAYNKDVYKG